MSLVRQIDFTPHGDDRGSLVALEVGSDVPFDIERIYYIYGTTPGTPRGFHAHKRLKQVFICVSGACTIVLDDGLCRESFRLSSPENGLYLEGLVWREMVDFTDDCVLLVLASEHYSESDYIRDYDDFKKLVE